MDNFTTAQLRYLGAQRLGRLATVDADAAPQNSPLGYRVDDDGTVVIVGHDLGRTRKFRNVRRNANVSLVVDDIVSVDPWRVRGVEIRGQATAVTDVDTNRPGISREQIRIRPERIIGWGLEAEVG